MSERKTVIAVIGAGDPSAEDARIAEDVGRELARRNAVLICGGLGGVMEAACRGAASEGGTTVGILPGENPETANPYVQIPVATGTGYARNVAVVKSAAAVIAVDGSYGTLTEIAYALQSGIPVVGLNTWKISSDNSQADPIVRAKTPAEAVEKALELAKDR